jgi:hypothetical protein
MTRNLFKNAIIFIIMIGILIYFLYFFSLKGFINMLELKEHLVNIYKPNRVFYNQGKIYLIDTQKIMDDENPKVFDTFKDFQKYILNLEEKHLVKLPLNRDDIEEGKNFIKQMEFEMDKSIDKPSFKHYKYSNTCNLKDSLCNFDNKMNLKKDNKKKIKGMVNVYDTIRIEEKDGEISVTKRPVKDNKPKIFKNNLQVEKYIKKLEKEIEERNKNYESIYDIIDVQNVDGVTSILNTKKSKDSNNPKYFTNYGEAQEYIKKLEEEYINQEVPRDSYTYKGSELLYKENQEKRERLKNIKNKEGEIKKLEKEIKIFMEELSKITDGTMEKQIKQQQLVKLISKKSDLEEIVFSLKSDKDDRKNKMIDQKKLAQFKKDKCNINYFSDEKCETIDDMENLEKEKRDGLHLACDIMKIGGDVCKDYNNNKWNRELLKSFCVKDNMNYSLDTCLIGEYYKDNIMDFE